MASSQHARTGNSKADGQPQIQLRELWHRLILPGRVPMIEMQARNPGAGAAGKELKQNVAAGILQQFVVAHAESVFGAVALGISKTVESN